MQIVFALWAHHWRRPPFLQPNNMDNGSGKGKRGLLTNRLSRLCIIQNPSTFRVSSSASFAAIFRLTLINPTAWFTSCSFPNHLDICFSSPIIISLLPYFSEKELAAFRQRSRSAHFSFTFLISSHRRSASFIRPSSPAFDSCSFSKLPVGRRVIIWCIVVFCQVCNKWRSAECVPQWCSGCSVAGEREESRRLLFLLLRSIQSAAITLVWLVRVVFVAPLDKSLLFLLLLLLLLWPPLCNVAVLRISDFLRTLLTHPPPLSFALLPFLPPSTLSAFSNYFEHRLIPRNFHLIFPTLSNNSFIRLFLCLLPLGRIRILPFWAADFFPNTAVLPSSSSAMLEKVDFELF